MWFDNWSSIYRIVLVGAAAYLWLVLVLRISGKRTLAKLNAFDFVVTVALGSTLATILLNSRVSWSEGATALVVLAIAQWVAAFTASRVGPARAVMTARPTKLVRDGRLLDDALREQRVTSAEIRQCVRAAGFGGLDNIGAVVLETDGTLSVVPTEKMGSGWALDDVRSPQG